MSLTSLSYGERELRFGYFYYLWNGVRVFPKPHSICCDAPDGATYARSEIIEATHCNLYSCPLDRSHVTGDYNEIQSVEYICGGRGGIMVHPDHFMLTERLGLDLLARNIKGAVIRRIPTVIAEPDVRPPEVYQLLFGGRNPLTMRIDPEEGNRCPWCGKSPLICPACSSGMSCCDNCGKRGIVSEKDYQGEGDNRIVVVPEEYNWIVDLQAWDGSDVFGEGINGFVTHRFVELLLRLGVFPFEAEPIPVNVLGAAAEQLAKLETALAPF